MKKQLVIILIMLLIIILVVAFAVVQNVNVEKELFRYNEQFDSLLNKEVLGTEVASLINKAIDTNEKNNIEKDKEQNYIANTTNSIKIYIKLQPDGENFPMERILKFGITEFVKNFNLEDFTCTAVNYHEETGKVSEIYFEII